MSEIEQACKKDAPFENFPIDYGIIQDCVTRLSQLTQAFDTLGMGAVVNELEDIGYLVRTIFEGVKKSVGELSQERKEGSDDG